MSTGAAGPGDFSAGLSVVSDPAAARADDIRQVTGNISNGVRLISSGTAFLFMGFVFAFFYLRSVNSNGLWHPAHERPVQPWGIAVMLFTILAAVIWDVVRRDVVSGTERRWRVGGLVALACAVMVIIAQGMEYATISFRTPGGGWASVFWGWSLVQLLFWLGAVYWIETLVAQSLRHPPASPREGSAGSELLAPSAAGCQVYLYMMTANAVVAYVLIYLVK
jgi:heme/copper-type cytochrome/quinol oxidase subunit 3